MNNSFQFVQNSQLNASRSKQTHLFGKGQRFRPVKTPNCSQSAYDLSRTMMTSTITPKSSILARDNRFKSSATISPSPNAYSHHAFIDMNRSAQRGHSFSLEPKGNDKNRHKIVPGPGNYEQIYNPEKKLSYTMRSKVNHKDNGIKVGPGQYHVENYHAFSKPLQISSKYNNPRNTVIGQTQRFKPRAFETIGPGPNGYGRVKTEMADSTKYSFGRVRKEPSYIRKNSNPGPNYYNRFSEFSQLKNGLPHMQSSRTLTYQ